MADTSLTVGGSAVDLSDPDIALTLGSLTLNLDEEDTLDWSCYYTRLPVPLDFHAGQSVVLSLNGQSHENFRGQVVRSSFNFSPEHGWMVGFHARGLRYLANTIPVTNANDSTGQITYNRKTTDPLYVPSEAGKTVGDMMKLVLDAHAAQLEALGVGTPAPSPNAGVYVADDFDLMAVTPPEPVTFSGPHLFNAIDTVLQRWQGLFVCRLAWDATTEDWRIRFVDPRTYPATTLTFGSDPIDPQTFRLTRDSTNSFGRVVVRGSAIVEAAVLSTEDGTLAPDWDSAQQEDWSWSSFANPEGMADDGDVTDLSTQSCACTSDHSDETWAANQWSESEGYIVLIDPAAANVRFSELRRISSNDAMAAGATATVQWTGDLDIIGESYTRYHIVATNTPMCRVWRAYDIVPEYVRTHLGVNFPKPVPWSNYNTLTMVSYPVAAIEWNNGATVDNYNVPASERASAPMLFELDRNAGQVVFREPVVKMFNTQSDLEAGGDSVVPPYNVKVMVPYATGVLSAVYPPDDAVTGDPTYSGTYHGEDPAVNTRTYYEDATNWVDKRQQSQYDKLAQMIQETIRDVNLDGSVSYLGLWSAGLGLANRLNFACEEPSAIDLGSDLASLDCPIRSVTVQWNSDGSGDHWTTTVGFNNRRQMATGENVVVHPAFRSQQVGLGGFVGGGFGDFFGGPILAPGFRTDGSIPATTTPFAATPFAGTPSAGGFGGMTPTAGTPTVAGMLAGPGGPQLPSLPGPEAPVFRPPAAAKADDEEKPTPAQREFGTLPSSGAVPMADAGRPGTGMLGRLTDPGTYLEPESGLRGLPSGAASPTARSAPDLSPDRDLYERLRSQPRRFGPDRALADKFKARSIDVSMGNDYLDSYYKQIQEAVGID